MSKFSQLPSASPASVTALRTILNIPTIEADINTVEADVAAAEASLIAAQADIAAVEAALAAAEADILAVEGDVVTLTAGQTTGMIGYTTRAELFAALAFDEGKLAMVTGDATAAYNGVYQKVGASGAGSWTLTTYQPTGPQGEQGPPGTNGTNGSNGINGIDGEDGLSAYQIAVSGGFSGTEAAWLLSLKGATGAQGPAGPSGTGSGGFVDVTTFIQSGDGGNLGLAITRALAAGNRNIGIPPGTYTVSNPFNYVEGMNIQGGNGWNPTLNHGPNATSTRINANNGFMKNPAGFGGNADDRLRFLMKDLYIRGNNTPGTMGVAGPFGGVIEQCNIERYDYCVHNGAGWLSRYYRCSFDRGDVAGLAIADANGCKVDECWFGAYNKTGLDTAIGSFHTPGGSGPALSMIVTNNNVNVSGVAGIIPQVGMRLMGNFILHGNYYEDFSTAGPTGNVLVELIANRFAKCSYDVRGNEMNGQGNALNCIRITGSHANLECRANGSITANRIFGAVQDEIGYGNPAVPGTNFVTYMRVFDNSDNCVVGVQSPLNPRARYRPISDVGHSSTVAIGGTTWRELPLSNAVLLDNSTAMRVANRWTCDKPGLYKFSAQLQHSSTAASYPNVEFKITKAGVDQRIVTGSLAYVSGTTFGEISLDIVLNCTAGQDVRLYARQGGNAVGSRLTAEFLGDGNY